VGTVLNPLVINLSASVLIKTIVSDPDSQSLDPGMLNLNPDEGRKLFFIVILFA
jgi:hypothetical protein